MASFIIFTWLSWLTLTAGFALKSGLDTGQSVPTTEVRTSPAVDISEATHFPSKTATSTASTRPSETPENTLEYLYIASSLQAKLNTSLHSTAQHHYPSRVDNSSASAQISPLQTPKDSLEETTTFASTDYFTFKTLLVVTTTVTQLSNLSTVSTATATESPSMAPHDIFANPIDTKSPPSNLKRQKDHPVPRTGIAAQGPLQTNKFFANFHLGDRHGPTYTFPYSMAWAGGKGATGSWGMACSHVEASQRVFGNEKFTGASAYYLNPVGIQALILGAADLGKDTALTMDSITAFSTRVHLSRNANSPPAVSFPIVQGMAYITGIYAGSIPRIQTGVYFKTVTRVTKFPKGHVTKFNFKLEDGSTWRLYAYRTRGDDLELEVTNNTLAQSKKPFFGSIHIAKDPGTAGSEQTLDDGAAVYPVTMKLSGTASNEHGTYSFNYQREGHDQGNMYMYALPHHVDSFDRETRDGLCKVRLQTTTKGLATLVKGSRWTMAEKLPIHMDLSPWHPEKGNMTRLSDHAKSLIHAAALKELSQNMIAQSNLDSMYFSGKVSEPFSIDRLFTDT